MIESDTAKYPIEAAAMQRFQMQGFTPPSRFPEEGRQGGVGWGEGELGAGSFS